MKFPILAIFYLIVSARAESISFKQLDAKTEIQATLTSTGCFHRSEYEFRFRKKDKVTVEVTEVRYRLDEKTKRREVEQRIPYGTTMLDDKEFTGLDRMLNFYRAEPRNYSTTHDKISLSVEKNGKPTATETYEDNSGSITEKTDITSFYSIILKIEQANEKSAPANQPDKKTAPPSGKPVTPPPRHSA